MAKKRFEDQPRRFRDVGPQHSGHLSGVRPGPKRAVNVSIDAGILKVAKEMKVNLSLALERALDKLTAEERARRFYEENKAFMDLHNELAEKYGTSSEAYAREFGNDD